MNKKATSIFLAVAFMLSGLNLMVGTTGILADSEVIDATEKPYNMIPVSTEEDLFLVSTNTTQKGYYWGADAYYYMTNNINLDPEINRTSIGGKITFRGVFNGNGYKITGFKNHVANTSSIGLFGYINSATIKNLSVDGNITSGPLNEGLSAGGIVGAAANSKIINCSFSGSIEVDGSSIKAGGIIGFADNTDVTYCYNTASVTVTGPYRFGDSYIGGIAGMSIGTISKCYNTGSLRGETNVDGVYNIWIGGIFASGTIVMDSYNTGPIYAANPMRVVAEGIANSNLVLNCYNTGSINVESRRTDVTGIIGERAVKLYVNYYILENQIKTNNEFFPDYTGEDLEKLRDGDSDPERKYYQRSGAKTMSQLMPSLADAKAGNSIFYTGTTTTEKYGKLSGWDFENVWILDGFTPKLRMPSSEVDIISSASITDIFAGTKWIYEVSTSFGSESGVSITVSGAPWLSVSGNKISGTAPALEDGADFEIWNVEIRAEKNGMAAGVQKIDIGVYENVTAKISILNMSGYTVYFDASGSTYYTGVLWDLGNGFTTDEVSFEYTFPYSGNYTVRMTAFNPCDSDVTTQSLLILDKLPIKEATYNKKYVCTLSINSSDEPPVLEMTGTKWLSVTDHNTHYVTVSGTPTDKDLINGTSNVKIKVGNMAYEWTIAIAPPNNWPETGFDVSIDDLEVKVSSTTEKWDGMSYRFDDNMNFMETSNGKLTYTYSKAGTYTITQRVWSTIDGVYFEYETSCTITVAAPVPAPKLTVKHLSGTTYLFDGGSSQKWTSLLWNFGDGKTSMDVAPIHEFLITGNYKVSLTASNAHSSVTIYQDVLVSDKYPISSANLGEEYRYTLQADIGKGNLKLSGASWLSITDSGNDHVTITGTPGYQNVYKKYDMRLVAGNEVFEWSVTVFPTADWPTAGFDLRLDGNKVTVIPNSTFWDSVSFKFFDNGIEHEFNGDLEWTYTENGTYTIVMRTQVYIDGEMIEAKFTRVVEIVSNVVSGPTTEESVEEPVAEAESNISMIHILAALLFISFVGVFICTRFHK